MRPRSPDHKVTVGWSPKLQSFWLKVVEPKNNNKLVTWVGMKEREIIDVVHLEKRAHRYAYFNNELKGKLKADRDAGAAS